MKPHRKLAAVLILTGVCLEARADALRWNRQRVDLVFQPEETQLATAFSFQNTGSAKVTIVSVEKSCSCLTPRLSKETFNPGETGSIEVVYEVGSRAGTQEKSITVTTDEPGAKPIQLVLCAKILRYLSVDPQLIYWNIGGDPTELTIMCTAQSEHAVEVTGVGCSLPEIVARIDPIEAGAKYAVRLRSAARFDHATALIELKVNVAGVGPKVFRVYAYFR